MQNQAALKALRQASRFGASLSLDRSVGLLLGGAPDEQTRQTLVARHRQISSYLGTLRDDHLSPKDRALVEAVRIVQGCSQ